MWRCGFTSGTATTMAAGRLRAAGGDGGKLEGFAAAMTPSNGKAGQIRPPLRSRGTPMRSPGAPILRCSGKSTTFKSRWRRGIDSNSGAQIESLQLGGSCCVRLIGLVDGFRHLRYEHGRHGRGIVGNRHLVPSHRGSAPQTCEGADPDRARYDSRGRSVPLQGSDEIRTRVPA